MDAETTNICDGGGRIPNDYRQLGVLCEFGNIANCVSDDEFLTTMKCTKKMSRVKWQPILKCLRERIHQGIEADWNSMWQEENLSEKFEALDKQKEKYADASRPEASWRPQLADVKIQLRSTDAATLQRHKQLLEQKAREYESRVEKLKKTVIPKRGYLRALQLEIQECRKKNDDICKTLEEQFEKHNKLAEEISPSKENFENSAMDLGCEV